MTRRTKRPWGAPWKLAELKRLGRTPDSVLARRTGRTIKEVVAMRESRGIGLVTGPRRWTAREIRLLGTLPDVEVARRLRRSADTVRTQRAALRIPILRPRAKCRAWKLWEIRLLGTISDAELARKLKRSRGSIAGQRCRLNIACRTLIRFWSPAEDKLLGKRPDSEIAKLRGCPTASVAMRRRYLGIARFGEQQQAAMAKQVAAMSDREIARLLRQSHRLVRRRKARRGVKAPEWTAAEDRLLGKWPDERVARLLGRTLIGIQQRRLVLGIRIGSPARRWTPEEERLLDPRAASGRSQQRMVEVARRLGRSVVAVRCHRRLKYGLVVTRRKWTARELRLLGMRVDREVARLTGRKPSTVHLKREALGIPSFRARHLFRWTAAKERLLGTVSDGDLAEHLGCGRMVVRARRHALGIPPGTYRRWTPQEDRWWERCRIGRSRVGSAAHPKRCGIGAARCVWGGRKVNSVAGGFFLGAIRIPKGVGP